MVESFYERYYDVFDKRRLVSSGGVEQRTMHHLSLLQNIDGFYQTQAKLIWNGTELNGRDAIAKYLIALPPTRHHIYSLDFFPMKGTVLADSISFDNQLDLFLELFPGEPTTYQVFTSGAVAYGTPESTSAPKEKRLFSHVFVLTIDVNSPIWVIANECFRFHE